ncbi:hypothetical protein ACSMXM_05445 [Pacificimonas sp. ICDLI1SI03]
MTAFPSRKLNDTFKLEVVDLDEQDFGTFEIRSSASNLQYRAAQVRAKKRLSRQEQLRLIGDNPDFELAHRLDVEAFIDALLVGWEVKNPETGEAIPFTQENAMAYFTAEKWLFEHIETEASRVSNFRVQEQERTAGNSAPGSNGKSSSRRATSNNSATA